MAPKQLCLIAFFLLFYGLSFAQTVTVKGHISDEKTRESISGAAIRLNGSESGVVSDASGNYIISGIKPGEYKIKVNFIGFIEFEKKIKVTAGQELILNIVLTSKTEDLNTVTVYGKLDKESESASRSSEKNADNITNVVGAKTIIKSPDINAANVLQRVSGVTIQRNSGGDDAYAVIRGVEPRYNNTLINGAKITSPDDKSRFVSLSVVPSDILQRIEVSKTLTPDMEGDAIGGTVNMVFKNAPDALLFNASASIGYSAIFLDRKYTDFSKKDIQAQSVYDRIGPTYNAQPSDFSKSNIDFKQVTAPPNVTAGFTFGNRFFNNKLGVLVADNYQNQYYGNNSQLNTAEPDPHNGYKPYITDISNRIFSNQQTNNGLVLHADYNFNDRNQISLDNVFLYSYFAQAYLSIDTTIVGGDAPRTIYHNMPLPGTGSIHEDNRSSTYHQDIENLKVAGKHILTDHLLLDWAGIYSISTKEAPDRADYTTNKRISYDSVTNKFISTPYYYDGGTRVWQHNSDKDFDGILNLSYKTKLGGNPLELKAGGLYRHKERDNFQNEYVLFAPGGNNSIGSRQQFFDIYSVRDSIINPNGTAGYDLNNYHAFENITAGYGEFRLVINKLDIVGGVRLENTSQGYHFLQVEMDAPDNVTKDYTDILPSLNLKYRLNEKTNIRASYFKSLSRPGYYELLPIAQPPANNGTQAIGNPNLQHTTADNFDLRYEFFPKPDQQLFIGGFYKKLQNPIENAFVGLDTYQPVNSNPATIYGGELVYTRYFGNFGVTGNYAITHSDVYGSKKDPETGVEVFQHRPLQGQANDALNLSLEYKNDTHKFFIQLAYQFIGKTLFRVNPDLGYDYYQQPQSFLSLSADKTFGKHFTVFGKFNNLLNTATVIKIDTLVAGHDETKPSGLIGVRYAY
jgi:outer membrane receptor protein involved in Fe transport